MVILAKIRCGNIAANLLRALDNGIHIEYDWNDELALLNLNAMFEILKDLLF